MAYRLYEEKRSFLKKTGEKILFILVMAIFVTMIVLTIGGAAAILFHFFPEGGHGGGGGTSIPHWKP